MKKFQDAKGRDWLLEISTTSLRRVRAALEVNLLAIVEGKELFERLASDPVLLCDVLFVLCQDQAKERSLSDEEFGLGLRGDVLDAATEALLEELCDFFPHPRKRAVLRKMLAKLKAYQGAAIDLVEAKLESPELEAWMRAQLEAALELPPVTRKV